MLKYFLLVSMTIISITSYSQNNYSSFKDDINNKLELLSSFSSLYFQNPDSTFDPDSLSLVIINDLTKYLKKEGLKNFDVNDFPSIEYFKSKDGIFEEFTFGYHSGGTAGEIFHSILIKHEKDQSYIYDLYTSLGEISFFDFFHLRDDIYLCIGIVPGSGFCIASKVFVIDFKDKDNLLVVPAFNGKDVLFMCNVDINYDKVNKILSLEYTPYYTPEDSYESFLKEYNYESFLSISESKISGRYSSAIFKTQYNGETFSLPRSK